MSLVTAITIARGRSQGGVLRPHSVLPTGTALQELSTQRGLDFSLPCSAVIIWQFLLNHDEKVRSKRNRWPTASPHVALVPLSVRVGASASSRGELPALDPAADLILRGGWDRCRWRCQEQALGGPVPPPTAGTYSAMDGRQY